MRLLLALLLLPLPTIAQTPKVLSFQRVKQQLVVTVENPFTVKSNILGVTLATTKGMAIAEAVGGVQRADKVVLALDMEGVNDGLYELWVRFDPLGENPRPIDLAIDLGIAIPIKISRWGVSRRAWPPKPKPAKRKKPSKEILNRLAAKEFTLPPMPPR